MTTMCMRVLTISVISAVLLTGCPLHTTPVAQMPQPATEAERNFEAYWQSSLDVLREYRFRIDFQDRRRGLIVTHPMVAKQFFEFWRRDAGTSYDLLEGSLQTVYLVASVQLTRAEPDKPDYELAVNVQRVRSDEIEPRAPGAAGWRASYQRQGGTGGDRPAEEQEGSMVRLGADEPLADQILVDIETEAILRMRHGTAVR